jgi:hypothetical protein
MTDNMEKKRADYNGLIIAAILIPVYLLFIYLGKEELGWTVFVVLGAIMLAVRVRWDLRRHAWFWGTIVLVLVLHVPLLFVVRWPPAMFHWVVMLPIAVADCLMTIGIVGLVEKFGAKKKAGGAPFHCR